MEREVRMRIVLMLVGNKDFQEKVEKYVNRSIKGTGATLFWASDVGEAEDKLKEGDVFLVVTTDFYWATMLLVRGQAVVYQGSFTAGDLGAKVVKEAEKSKA